MRLIKRYWRLPWKDWALLAECGLALLAASVAIRVVPFRVLVRTIASGRGGFGDGRAKQEIDRVRWAVEAVGRRLPWRVVCFQKGLAVQRLLAQRGIPSDLHYGVAHEEHGELKAHVWVTHRDEYVIGGEEAARFARLASYPSRGSCD
jgi:hypothetical protein